MISGPVPKTADPERLADQQTAIVGEVDAKGLVRLREILAPEGDVLSVQGRLAFTRDARGRVVMTGSAQAALSLTCQRCGAPFSRTVAADWAMVFALSETDEKSLAEQGVDVWYHQGVIDVAEIFEDEVMLALPMAPRHPGDCEPQSVQEFKPHPFAALAGLFDRGLHDK
jgi:uncharacterized protein